MKRARWIEKSLYREEHDGEAAKKRDERQFLVCIAGRRASPWRDGRGGRLHMGIGEGRH